MAWTPEQRAKYYAVANERRRTDPECKKRQREAARMHRHNLKKEIIAMMGGKCARCGWNEHMFGLEFDHKNPLEKKCGKNDSPSDLISGSGFAKASAYITKNCIMLCGCCHALKTVAYGDNLRGEHVSDTTWERELYESKMPKP